LCQAHWHSCRCSYARLAPSHSFHWLWRTRMVLRVKMAPVSKGITSLHHMHIFHVHFAMILTSLLHCTQQMHIYSLWNISFIPKENSHFVPKKTQETCSKTTVMLPLFYVYACRLVVALKLIHMLMCLCQCIWAGLCIDVSAFFVGTCVNYKVKKK